MNYRRRNIWIQSIGWLALYTFFFSMSNYFQTTGFAAISSVFETAFLLAFYLITVKYLFAKYYSRGWLYVLISLLAIILYSGLIFGFDVTVIGPHMKHWSSEPPILFHYVRRLMSVVFIFIVGTSIQLIEQTNRLKENEKLLTEEKLKTELQLLKAQINPHFIFNALNNIYSLTYMQSANAPESVLKLSEMLRYVFYDCSKDRVAVTSEIRYIENFNAFQQMKSSYIQNISLQTDLGYGSIEIAPMLFIPFLENAFKYSRIEEIEEAYVNILIKNEAGKLTFAIENSVPENNKPKPGSGLGIKNVKHRLKIIYPQNHVLTINESGDKFNVELSIMV
ncbi:sensor histidine kinase [Geofilum sp. OHC36d9]|uniref:sensor histidine kinase n=1 Tax=Geofilum sp. OHC36d9 TaxID=3458413 RepID=UPI0040333EA8